MLLIIFSDTVDMIYEKYNISNKSKEELLYEAREFKKLAYYKTDKIGNISKSKLEKIYNIYRVLGLAKRGLDIDKIIYTNRSKNIKLSDEEKRHLQDMGKIDLCVDPDWLPFDKIDKNGKHIGISADYIKLFEKFLSTKINLVKTSSWSEALDFAKDKKCDILTSIVSTPERKKYLNFTTSYNEFPLVAATKMDSIKIKSISDLKGKKIGATNGYAFANILKVIYPTIEIIEVKSVDEGLEKVNNKEIFAFIDTLPSIVYKIRSKQSANLKVSGNIYDHWNLRIGVRKDDKILLNAIQKAIDSISDTQKQKILKKWILIEYENRVDYGLIWKILALSFIVLFVVFAWNRQIRAKNILLQKTQNKVKEKNRSLQTLATTDRLTGINNRLKLDSILDKEVTRSRRYKNMFGISIMDIDNFKNVNDTYGHQVGDNILQEVAKVLKQCIRDTDYVGRWGGEEFLLICLEVDENALHVLIEKIKNRIKNHDFLHVEQITASFGVTSYKKDDGVESILKRADDALYKAKEKGKNRVVIV